METHSKYHNQMFLRHSKYNNQMFLKDSKYNNQMFLGARNRLDCTTVVPLSFPPKRETGGDEPNK